MVLLSIGVHQHQQDANGERDGKYSNIFEERELCVKWWLLEWQGWSGVKCGGVSTHVICIWRIQSLLPLPRIHYSSQPGEKMESNRLWELRPSSTRSFCCFVRWDNIGIYSILATFSCFETVPLYQRKIVEINQIQKEGMKKRDCWGILNLNFMKLREIIWLRILLADIFIESIYMN